MASPVRSRGQGARSDESPRRWGRILVAVLVLVFAGVAMAGWFDKSEATLVELGSPQRILFVNDAGPVMVRTVEDDRVGSGSSLVHADSWLFSRPQVQIESDLDGVVVRLSCRPRFPCRSSAELVVQPGVELVVVSTDGLLEVSRFEGDMTLYGSGRGVVVGPIVGSARIVSDGPIRGFDLFLTELNVLAGAEEVDLTFARSPAELTVETGVGPVRLVLPNRQFHLDVETASEDTQLEVRTSETANRVIVVRALGPVVVVN